jgi:hypothetical protein
MSDRERFETYVADKHPEITEGMTNVLWLVWQAAQATPVEPQKLEAQEPLKLIAPIAYATPPAEPFGYIGADTFTALSGGETVVQCITPSRHMETDVALFTAPPAEPDMVSPPPKIRALHTASGYFNWSWPSVGVGELSYRTKSDGDIEFSAENMNAYRVRQLLHAFADVVADEYAEQIGSAK